MTGRNRSFKNLALCLAIAGLAWPQMAQAQDNDECEDCIQVGDGSFPGTTADNTGSTGDDTSCTFNDWIDEWYCYTAS